MKFNVTQYCGKWIASWTRSYEQFRSIEDSELITHCMIHFSDRFFVTEKEEYKLFICSVQFNTD